MSSDKKRDPQSSWPRTVLVLAGIYNVVWGTLIHTLPNALFRLSNIAEPTYPGIWQCVGTDRRCLRGGLSACVSSTSSTLADCAGRFVGQNLRTNWFHFLGRFRSAAMELGVDDPCQRWDLVDSFRCHPFQSI